MAKVAVFPGTFDPITFGHLDVIERVLSIVDRLVIAVAVNDKKKPMFEVDHRVAMVRDALGRDDVVVEKFDGLLIDFLKKLDINLVVRGVRHQSECDRELLMLSINRKLYPNIDAILMPASEEYRCTSSSYVKEIASLGGDVSSFVSTGVADELKRKFGL